MSTHETEDLKVSRSSTETKPPLYIYDAESSGFSYALADFVGAFKRPRLALTLIRAGFIQRHNGISQAIFWIIALNAATVGGMSILWGRIFDTELEFYLPYLTAGLITWGLMSSLLTGAAGVFIAARGTFNDTPIPKSLFAIRTVGIDLAAFSIKLVVLAGALAIVSHPVDFGGLVLAATGLALIVTTGYSLCLSVGVLGARFRDVPQLTNVAMTFAFFLTPVFWTTDRLGDLSWVVTFNPLYHYLNVFRGSLMGFEGLSLSFAVAGGFTASSLALGAAVYGFYGRRLTYWN